MTPERKPPSDTHEVHPGSAEEASEQLGMLLETARSMADEEFRRSERLDAKSRNQFTAIGALFAVIMATTAGVLNALIDTDKVDHWVYPLLGGCALATTVALGLALAWSLETWRLRVTDTLDPDTIETYIPYAERGNRAVAINLIRAYAHILRERQAQNKDRADVLKRATVACGLAGVASLVQLGAVFVALMSK